ncbi:MAG TPA: ThiF family adenylyltransferase [Candidatus Hydrogenedentes bacterium]|nr:ThiF family adenylyltransferase [Candidatus Hydrogenedentota bacterium]
MTTGRTWPPGSDPGVEAEDLRARTRLLLGDAGLERLRRARVLVAGLGGVGGHVAEALARAGVGTLIVVDADRFAPSNLNRQVLATRADLGTLKARAAVRRFLDIDPDLRVEPVAERITPDNALSLLERFLPLDAVVEAIDDVPAKAALLAAAVGLKMPVVSCMGAGARWRVSAPRVADLSATRGCPLARATRRLLRARGILSGVTCVFFDTPADVPVRAGADGGRGPVGSISYPPGLIGLTAAGVVVEGLVAGLPTDPTP